MVHDTSSRIFRLLVCLAWLAAGSSAGRPLLPQQGEPSQAAPQLTGPATSATLTHRPEHQTIWDAVDFEGGFAAARKTPPLDRVAAQQGVPTHSSTVSQPLLSHAAPRASTPARRIAAKRAAYTAQTSRRLLSSLRHPKVGTFAVTATAAPLANAAPPPLPPELQSPGRKLKQISFGNLDRFAPFAINGLTFFADAPAAAASTSVAGSVRLLPGSVIGQGA